MRAHPDADRVRLVSPLVRPTQEVVTEDSQIIVARRRSRT